MCFCCCCCLLCKNSGESRGPDPCCRRGWVGGSCCFDGSCSGRGFGRGFGGGFCSLAMTKWNEDLYIYLVWFVGWWLGLRAS